MAYEQKAGEFVLFKNDKGDNPKRPDYKGDGLDAQGRPIEVAAWLKDGKKGKFMSCKIKLKDEDISGTKRSKDVDSDVPF